MVALVLALAIGTDATFPQRRAVDGPAAGAKRYALSQRDRRGGSGVTVERRPRSADIRARISLLVALSADKAHALRYLPQVVAAARAAGVTDPAQLAYILATVRYETGDWSTLSERGGEARFRRLYDWRPDIGNVKPGDGARFRGRGFVQITGRRNYARFSRLVGVDLVARPDLALRPAIAARIAVLGMESGAFTGYGLDRYVGGGRADYLHARRIVNGMDRADTVSRYAVAYYRALRSGSDT